jgi:glutamate/tyrosine decarboxylase-like PLP-dependent enzyme
MPPDEFRRVGHELVDRIAEFLKTLPDGRVTPGESARTVRDALNADRRLPEHGVDAGTLLKDAAELLFAHSLFNGHPRFLGYITSSPAPIGMLGDVLAAAVNSNSGAWTLAPMATEIEAQTVRWIAELMGYPVDAGGLLVSGGNMANFVCFLAARLAKAPNDVRKEGVGGRQHRYRIYTSAETHTWIQKAADLFGYGTDAVRWIATDADQRMNVGALAKQIDLDRKNGDLPFLVIGTAGSVSTGAVDPLRALAGLCRDQQLWFHVDGAYGGFAVAVPDATDDLKALREADSVAVDPHKWLYAPLEAGCALVRRAEDLRNAFAYHPPYYHFGDEVTNYVDYGPQNSRGFRALKVWLGLQQAGRAGCVQMMSDDIALARRLDRNVRAHAEFEALTQSLSITTFRYVPSDLRASMDDPHIAEYLNTLNSDLLSRIEKSGDAFLSNAIVNGTFALRACIVNFRTTEADIDALPEMIAALGRTADAALRASGSGPGR